MAAAGTGSPATPCMTDEQDINVFIQGCCMQSLAGWPAYRGKYLVLNLDMQEPPHSILSQPLWKPCWCPNDPHLKSRAAQMHLLSCTQLACQPSCS